MRNERKQGSIVAGTSRRWTSQCSYTSAEQYESSFNTIFTDAMPSRTFNFCHRPL